MIMPIWETVVYSYDKKKKEVLSFEGDRIEALSPRLAQIWCNKNGKGYLKVTGHKIICDIDAKTGKRLNFEENHLNS
jgi:hypothetical protein